LDQGRYKEAEKLIRTQLEIFDALGVTRGSQQVAKALNNLASLQALQEQWPEASVTYAVIDEATASWETERKAQLISFERVVTLLNTERVEEGIGAAKQLLSRSIAHFGLQHVYTAYAQAAVAVGLSRQNRDSEALDKFRAATPIILGAGESGDSDELISAAARDQRIRLVIEEYLSLLARSPQHDHAAMESFPLADAIRNRAVQRALTQSGARAVAGDGILAELARREQDTIKQITAQLNVMNDSLARPKEQRDEASIRDLQARIEGLRNEDRSLRERLAREFPAYLKLIDPKSAPIEEVRKALKPDEALLSFYTGSRQSFVWVISAQEPIAFAGIELTAKAITAKVRALRRALEPQVATVNEIPPFDLKLAYELYVRLLKPIETTWSNAKNLFVVTNGALGELPLSLLPTAPSQLDLEARPLFAGYRDVPWLARTHAVTVIPSASALATLRRLPPGSPDRDALIGFGDPYFNAEQATQAEEELSAKQIQVASVIDMGSLATRRFPLILRASPRTEDVDKAELAMLPRLPDTRLELMAIAKALHADPTRALYLGKDANEHNVESLDLSHYRIVAFATHGLVPDDLDGLTQPALALTAPDIAGTKGEGLLTMEKILALKLNADWVLLSACNTAAGAGAGAEAASGLGRAFFYAGSRAILVTNWSVHSASARQLVSDVFRRQADNPTISRAEALRQSMMSMVDEGGYQVGTGDTLFAYAHPLFWAPYSIVGDGG
jgi:CHAT domain-containing protein